MNSIDHHAPDCKAPIKLGILGASGKLGNLIAKAALNDARFQLSALLVHEQSSLLEQAFNASLNYQSKLVAPLDVLIDVSLPQSTSQLANFLAPHTALVSGVTGHDAKQFAALHALSETHALLHTHNFSRGIALLQSLLEQAANALPGFDIGIIDTHHSAKRDAPSGTARSLEASLRQGGATTVQQQALRIGSVVGEHSVHFAAQGEELIFTHRAADRSVFALGALDAAAFVCGQAAGSYSMRDVLGLAD
jgi:4-hydroxy-tetrahydrodipicolinate reductase